MQKFQIIRKPPGYEGIEHESYLLDAGSIAGAKGPIFQCQVLMQVHPDFDVNVENFREKIEKFFDAQFLAMLQ